MRSIEERLSGLEKSARRWRALAVLLLCGVGLHGLLGATGTTRPALDEVRTKKLVVVDDKGRVAVSLEADADGGHFRAMDGKTGKQVVMLGAASDRGGLLSIENAVNTGSIVAHVDEHGATFHVFGTSSETAVSLVVVSDIPWVATTREGKEQWMSPLKKQ